MIEKGNFRLLGHFGGHFERSSVLGNTKFFCFVFVLFLLMLLLLLLFFFPFSFFFFFFDMLLLFTVIAYKSLILISKSTISSFWCLNYDQKGQIWLILGHFGDHFTRQHLFGIIGIVKIYFRILHTKLELWLQKNKNKNRNNTKQNKTKQNKKQKTKKQEHFVLILVSKLCQKGSFSLFQDILSIILKGAHPLLGISRVCKIC